MANEFLEHRPIAFAARREVPRAVVALDKNYPAFRFHRGGMQLLVKSAAAEPEGPDWADKPWPEIVIPPSEAENLARRFHELYEEMAPRFSYETRRASAVPWDLVPENNRLLMVAVCTAILKERAAAERSDLP
jgi:hypothetical protein